MVTTDQSSLPSSSFYSSSSSSSRPEHIFAQHITKTYSAFSEPSLPLPPFSPFDNGHTSHEEGVEAFFKELNGGHSIYQDETENLGRKTAKRKTLPDPIVGLIPSSKRTRELSSEPLPRTDTTLRVERSSSAILAQSNGSEQVEYAKHLAQQMGLRRFQFNNINQQIAKLHKQRDVCKTEFEVYKNLLQTTVGRPLTAFPPLRSKEEILVTNLEALILQTQKQICLYKSTFLA